MISLSIEKNWKRLENFEHVERLSTYEPKTFETFISPS